jgi:hypothetical protein
MTKTISSFYLYVFVSSGSENIDRNKYYSFIVILVLWKNIVFFHIVCFLQVKLANFELLLQSLMLEIKIPPNLKN